MNLGSENEQTEFKKTTSEIKEAMDSICAILNKHGSGVLYFGVRQDGEVVGQSVEESTLRKVSQAIGNAIAPAIRPAITRKTSDDGKAYVEVKFSGNEPPYSSNGRFKIRVADEDILMSPTEVRAMALDAEARLSPWDCRPSGRPMGDIEESVLMDYVARGNECGRISFSYSGIEDALARLDLLTPEGELTNAAAVLFCKSRIPMLKMGVFDSHDRVDILDIQQIEGTLFDLARKAEFYVLSNIRRRVDIEGTGIERREIPELPMPAVREAIMNGLAHSDYHSGEAMQVDIFTGSVEIYNPGWFLDGQTPEAHLSGEDKRSKSRNQLIAATLFKSKDIESYGTGMPRIKRLCDMEGIKVEYLKVLGGTRVVFHRNDPFGGNSLAEVGRSWPKLAEVGRSLIGDDESLNAKEKDVCVAILNRGEASSTSIATDLEMSTRTARRILADLVEKGAVIVHGNTNRRTYILDDAYFSAEHNNKISKEDG